MAVHLHNFSPHSLLVNYKNINLWKWWHCACNAFTIFIVCIHSVEECVLYVRRCIMFLYKVESQTTGQTCIIQFLVVFTDPCEQGSFWQHYELYKKLFKNVSFFSTLCKWTLRFCDLRTITQICVDQTAWQSVVLFLDKQMKTKCM